MRDLLEEVAAAGPPVTTVDGLLHCCYCGVVVAVLPSEAKRDVDQHRAGCVWARTVRWLDQHEQSG